MAPLIIGRPDQKVPHDCDNRMFVEGVLWIVRTGSLYVIFRKCLRLKRVPALIDGHQGCLVADIQAMSIIRTSNIDRRLCHRRAHGTPPGRKRGLKIRQSVLAR
jgi:uncharacterized protein (DUF2342 family)